MVEALDVGVRGEIEIEAVRQALAGKRVLQILLGLGSLERRHVPSSAWSEKPMMRGRCARRSRESIQSREFLICGWSRVPVDADDHVDAADGGARGRLRQARDGELARNVEQPAGILEKELMLVTDVGVAIAVRAGKGARLTIRAGRQ